MSDGIELEIDVEHMAVTRALTDLAGATGRPLADVIRQNSRLIAVNLAFQTQPLGDDKNAKDQGERAVWRDIGNVYTTPQRMYAELKKAKAQGEFTGEQMARGFFAACRRGDVAEAQRILRRSGISGHTLPVQRFDGGAAHQRRRNNRGRIGGRAPSMVVIDERSVARYGREIQKRVGSAKAGWAHCARELGGTRGIPQFVTRHRNRVNGTVIDRTNGTDELYVVMSNTTPWIRDVLTERQQLEALRIQREKMLTHVSITLDRLAQKSGLWVQRVAA